MADEHAAAAGELPAGERPARVAAAGWTLREQVSRRLSGLASWCEKVARDGSLCFERSPDYAEDWCPACVAQRAATLLAAKPAGEPSPARAEVLAEGCGLSIDMLDVDRRETARGNWPLACIPGGSPAMRPSATSFRCVKCGLDNVEVIDSRSNRVGDVTRRRRQCRGCGHRFTTYESLLDPRAIRGVRARVQKAVDAAIRSCLEARHP